MSLALTLTGLHGVKDYLFWVGTKNIKLHIALMLKVTVGIGQHTGQESDNEALPVTKTYF